MDTTRKLRVGIIGIGNIGSAHLLKIHRDPELSELQLTAVCDISPEKAAFCKEFAPDVPFFTSHQQLISSGLADAVIIATPHYFHVPMAIDAFRAGLHVLTEKPAGVDISQVEKMNREARKSGKVFGIMFNQRTNRLFALARQIVSTGGLGELKRSVWIITNWYRKQAYYDSGSWRGKWNGEGGGVLINQAPHNLDLWQWICGMPCRLRAECRVGQYPDIEVEDDATVFAEYENGARGVFITSTGEYTGTNRLEISGTRGKIVLENGTLRFYELATDEREYCRSPLTGKNKVTVREWTDEPLNGHAAILKNFASAVLHGTPLLAPGYDGIHELTLSNAAYLSAWTGEAVSLPFDQARFTAELNKRRQESAAKDKLSTSSPDGSYLNRWNTNW